MEWLEGAYGEGRLAGAARRLLSTIAGEGGSVVRKVRIKIDYAVTALIGTGKSTGRAIDRKTLRGLQEALRAGKWRILPRDEATEGV